MRFFSILVMVLAGFFLSIQGPINGRLRLALESPVFAAVISFLSAGLFFCVSWQRVHLVVLERGYEDCSLPRPGLTSVESSGSVMCSEQLSLFPTSVLLCPSAPQFSVK